MDIFLSFLKAFAVGGAICAVGQIIMDLTKLTPGRILVCFVVAGVVLGAVGVYKGGYRRKRRARHPDGSTDCIERGDNRGGALRSYRVICCETQGKIKKKSPAIHKSV